MIKSSAFTSRWIRRFALGLLAFLLAEMLVLLRLLSRAPGPQNILEHIVSASPITQNIIVDYSGSIKVSWDELKEGTGLLFPNACGVGYHQQATTAAIDKDEITMVVHAGISKLERIRFSIERWNGYVSASLYVTSQDDLDRTLELCSQLHNKQTNRQQTTIHLYMEKFPPDKHKPEYPHNVFRQMALDYAPTNYFLALDVDFVTPPNAAQSLYRLLKQNNNTLQVQLQSHNLLVLPAFEGHVKVNDTKLLSQGMDTDLVDQALPRDKFQVASFLKQGKLTPFHLDVCPQGQGSSNYPKWQTTTEPYWTDYTMRYEPYVIGYKADPALPRYWHAFRGFGYNKWTWIAEAYLKGFNLIVLACDVCFVTHLHHDRNPTFTAQDSNQRTYLKWLGHIQDDYGWSDYNMDWIFKDRKELRPMDDGDEESKDDDKSSSSSSTVDKDLIPRFVEWTVWKGRVVGRLFTGSSLTTNLRQRDRQWVGTAPIVGVDDIKALQFGMTVQSASGQKYYLSDDKLDWIPKKSGSAEEESSSS